MNISKLKQAALSEQLEKALSQADWTNRNVLVGCLRDRQQLRVCLRHGFYHMPADRVEEDVGGVKWIAIYQSRTLFGNRGGIRYYGRVTDCKLVPRSEIREIPRDSDTPYYRFAVPRWIKLSGKVVSKELPFTHMLTTEFLLKNSRETPELFLEDEQQFRLYRALRKLLSRPRFRTAGFRFGDGVVVLKRGEICTLQNGELHPSYIQENFADLPYTVFSHILLELSGSEQ